MLLLIIDNLKKYCLIIIYIYPISETLIGNSHHYYISVYKLPNPSTLFKTKSEIPLYILKTLIYKL